MIEPQQRPSAHDRRDLGLWFAAIVLVAANLRPVIASVPPLVGDLASAFGLSAVGVGALTTLPVVCMGVFAPLAAVLTRRALPVAVGLIVLGAAARAVGGVAWLYAGTAVAGIGIAIAGTLLPSLVRALAPDRVGPVTGLYTAALITGAFIAAGSTEPLRSTLDISATAVLALWALPAAVALGVVLLALAHSASPHSLLAMVSAPGQPSAHDRPNLGRLPWRSRQAWLVTLFMGAQSLMFYATLAWFAALYINEGYSTQRAGLLLAVFSAAQIPTALVMPMLAHRTGHPRAWVAASISVSTTGLVLVAAVPTVAPWLWAGLVGIGMGGNLSLALTVLTQAAPDHAAARGYAAMAFFVGYLMAAIGPVAAGALLEATSYRAVFATLGVLGAVTLVIGVASAGSRSGSA
jgi:CP family cyanate transporter-like MFS transporter